MSLTKLSGRQIETPVDISAVNLTGITTAANLNVTGVSTLSSAIVGSAVTITAGGIVAGLGTVNNFNATQLNVTGVSTLGITTFVTTSTGNPNIITINANSAANSSNIHLSINSGNTAQGGIRLDTGGKLHLRTYNSGQLNDCLTILSNGAVSIGSTLATGTANQLFRVEDGAYFANSIGIGNTKPVTINTFGRSLDVSDNSGGSLVLRDANTTSGYKTKYVATRGGVIYVGRASDDGSGEINQLAITQAGSVGINTVEPQSSLHIFQPGTHYITLEGETANTTCGLILKSGSNGASGKIQLVQFLNDLILYTGASADPPERLRIKGSTGNIGINTAVPDCKLEVVDETTTNSVQTVLKLTRRRRDGLLTNGTGPRLSFEWQDSTYGPYEYATIEGTQDQGGSYNDGSFVVRTTVGGISSERLRIDRSKNLFFGDYNRSDYSLLEYNKAQLSGSNTTGRISVLNTVGSAFQIFNQTVTGNNWGTLSLDSLGAGIYFRTFSSGYDNRFQFYAAGSAYNTTGTWSTISDARLKQDVIDAGNQWNDIKSLRFVNYKLKSDVEYEVGIGTTTGYVAPRMFGLIAQEVEETSPGLVENLPRSEGPYESVKGLKTSIITLKAVKALQEAMERIEKLENELKLLKSVGISSS